MDYSQNFKLAKIDPSQNLKDKKNDLYIVFIYMKFQSNKKFLKKKIFLNYFCVSLNGMCEICEKHIPYVNRHENFPLFSRFPLFLISG